MNRTVSNCVSIKFWELAPVMARPDVQSFPVKPHKHSRQPSKCIGERFFIGTGWYIVLIKRREVRQDSGANISPVDNLQLLQFMEKCWQHLFAFTHVACFLNTEKVGTGDISPFARRVVKNARYRTCKATRTNRTTSTIPVPWHGAKLSSVYGVDRLQRQAAGTKQTPLN